jgi:hypothetical protein
MEERSLSMREARGSIPGLSKPALHVGDLYSSVGHSARLVSARSGGRTFLAALLLLLGLLSGNFYFCHSIHGQEMMPKRNVFASASARALQRPAAERAASAAGQYASKTV